MIQFFIRYLNCNFFMTLAVRRPIGRQSVSSLVVCLVSWSVGLSLFPKRVGTRAFRSTCIPVFVGWLVGRSVIISLKVGKSHFPAPVGALVSFYLYIIHI